MSADLFAQRNWPPDDARVIRIGASYRGDVRLYEGTYGVIVGDLVTHWRAELADGQRVTVAKSRCQDTSATAARTATRAKRKPSVSAAKARPEAIKPEYGVELTIFDELGKVDN